MNLHSFLHRLAEAPAVALAGLLLVGLTILGVLFSPYLVRSLRRAADYGVALVSVTVFWWLVNHRLEGRVLFVVASGHGLTIGDMLGVPALLLAAILFVFAKGHRSAPASRVSSVR